MIEDPKATARPAADTTPDATPENPWPFWAPWALAGCFAILSVLLLSLGQSLRQQLAVATEESRSLREQVARIEDQSALEGTNYHTRITDIQRQVVHRVEELNRQHATLTNQLQLQNTEARQQLLQARDQIRQLGREKKALEEAIRQMTVPDPDRLSSSRLVILRPTPDGPAGVIGAVLWNPSEQRGILVLESLPPPPAGQSYQLWLTDPRLAIPINGGVLPRSTASTASTATSQRIPFQPQIRVDNAERFSLTLEPAAGSPSATGNAILSSR